MLKTSLIPFNTQQAFEMQEANILIADDDENIRDLLTEMLEPEGFQVFRAANGKEAVQIAGQHPIHAAVLDIRMPVMDGIEALREIKKTDPSIEVLIITGNANLENLRMTIVDNGAFDYILKPFFQAELIHALRNALLKRAYMLVNGQSGKKDRIARLEADFEERTRQLRESQIKYKEIIENSGDSIMVYQDGHLKFMNTNMTELTGYTLDELFSIPFARLLFPKDRETVENICQDIMEHRHAPPTSCFRIMRKNGEMVWVEAGSKRTIWEERSAVLTFIRDITDRKRTEDALRSAHDGLERRVEARTAELLKANSRLKHEIVERKQIEADMKSLLKKQEIDIGLAKDILNLINGFPSRHIDLSAGLSLFVHAISLPCLTEGGDHFFVKTFDISGRRKTVISLKDQSGHAVNCVLRSIVTDMIHQSLLHQYETLSPETTMSMLNNFICCSDIFKTEDFVTSVTTELDHETLMLRYVSNGHPPFLLIRDNEVTLLSEIGKPGTNIPLAWKNNHTFSGASIRLQKGDRLVFYTDGLNEMPHMRHDQIINFEELKALAGDMILQHPGMTVSDIMEMMFRKIAAISHAGAGQSDKNTSDDDITMVGIEVEDRNGNEEIWKPKDFEETASLTADLFQRIADEWRRQEFESPEPRLQVILEEAVWNAWKHGNQKDPRKTITIRWRYGNDFHLEIIDQGEGFAYEEVPDPTIKKNLTRAFGRGIFFIRNFASSVKWEDRGRQIRITLPRQSDARLGEQGNRQISGELGKILKL
ncbi:response regulator [Desulfococcaceae bacterium HSG8]|nr:response regulator [Desulfococcaceae bacterium HSG8]